MVRSMVSVLTAFFAAAACLPVCASALETGGAEVKRSGQTGQLVETVHENILPVGGVSVIEPVEDMSGAQADIAPELRVNEEIPGFYKYDSEYGREYLAKHKPKPYVDCYDVLNEQCMAFEGNYETIDATDISGGDYYYMPKVTGRSYSCELTLDQIREVLVTLLKDHPGYYWLESFTYSYYSVDGPYIVNLTVTEDYAEGSVRRELDEEIQTNFEKYVSAAEKYKAQGEYMTAKKVHDDIAAAVDYGYDYFEIDDVMYRSPSNSAEAHTIVSVLDDDENTMPVCEGYAEAYSLILNALGIDNLTVMGIGKTDSGTEPHEWNLVRLDDGRFYWVDVTWDDQEYGIIYDYFARGNNGFAASHEQNTPQDVGFAFQYSLPDVPDDDFEVMAIINDEIIKDMSVIHSGKLGNNCEWAIYENRVLYISGDGDMPGFSFDYNSQVSTAPWFEYQSDISIVVVGDGVTSVSDHAFWKCYTIAYVYFPDGIETIGQYVLGNCGSIKAIRLPSSLRSIGDALVFSNNCEQFSDIYYGGTEAEWESVGKARANIPEDIVMHYNYMTEPVKEQCVKISAEYDEQGNLITVLMDTIFKEDAGEPVLTGTKKIFIWNSLDGMRPIVKKEQ